MKTEYTARSGYRYTIRMKNHAILHAVGSKAVFTWLICVGHWICVPSPAAESERVSPQRAWRPRWFNNPTVVTASMTYIAVVCVMSTTTSRNTCSEAKCGI